MSMLAKLFLFLLFSCVGALSFAGQHKHRPFVTSCIQGQLGNNLFQVAAASALAWDHKARPCFPGFDPNSDIYKHVFFRFKTILPSKKVRFVWNEPIFSYTPISYHHNMQISGYFQSEKYFAHYRSRLLELFAPHPDDLAYIQKKYSWLLTHPDTVGVQIRYYRCEVLPEKMYPQYGGDYLEHAMALFSKESLFVVSSNNLDFARKSIPSWAKNVVFIENEPNYINLYLLSFCKHNIITNSSFGWWGAWLNRNPNKKVVYPKHWIAGLPTQDVCPPSWLGISASYQ